MTACGLYRPRDTQRASRRVCKGERNVPRCPGKKKSYLQSGGMINSMTSSHVDIQTSPQSVQSTPSWLREVAVMAPYLILLGLLEKIVQEVRLSRKRFGTYETIDFICVLIAYTLSG